MDDSDNVTVPLTLTRREWDVLDGLIARQLAKAEADRRAIQLRIDWIRAFAGYLEHWR
jgi:hypothetical protein